MLRREKTTVRDNTWRGGWQQGWKKTRNAIGEPWAFPALEKRQGAVHREAHNCRAEDTPEEHQDNPLT